MNNLNKYKRFILATFVSLILVNLTLFIKDKYNIKSFPNRPITIIVPYKPYGGTDLNARLLSKALYNEFKIKSKIKYIPSNDGGVGYAAISQSKKDGYTIGFINIPTFLTLPIEKETLYNKNNIYPLINISIDPCVLVVRKSENINTLPEFIKLAKNNPYKISISDNGLWTSDYLASIDFCNTSGIDVVNVPFSGSNDMLKALDNGYVYASIAKLSEVTPWIEKGKFKILASFTNTRLSKIPNTPILKEYGYKVYQASLRSVVIPKGVNKEIIDKLTYILTKSINSNYAKEEANKENIYLKYMDTKQLNEYMNKEENRMKVLIDKIKLK